MPSHMRSEGAEAHALPRRVESVFSHHKSSYKRRQAGGVATGLLHLLGGATIEWLYHFPFISMSHSLFLSHSLKLVSIKLLNEVLRREKGAGKQKREMKRPVGKSYHCLIHFFFLLYLLLPLGHSLPLQKNHCPYLAMLSHTHKHGGERGWDDESENFVNE